MLIKPSEIKTIYIPNTITNLRIDVGLAREAPNSAIWLSTTNDRYVIGIEPLKEHWNYLKEYSNRKCPNVKIVQLNRDCIIENNNEICKLNNRFCGIIGAIDNINNISETSFYKNFDEFSGSSSLLKQNIIGRFEKELKVETFSLEYLIDNIPKKFEFIEHIKTDCEGKDFDVVKSIGKYLKNVAFISSEVRNNNPNEWIGTQNSKEFIEFMRDNNFSIFKDDINNIDFINNKLINIIKSNNLSCITFGA